MRSSRIIHVRVRTPTSDIHSTNNKVRSASAAIENSSALLNNQTYAVDLRTTVSSASRIRSVNNNSIGSKHTSVSPNKSKPATTFHDRFSKPIVRQNSTAPLNNRTHTAKTTKMSRHYSSMGPATNISSSLPNGVHLQSMHQQSTNQKKQKGCCKQMRRQCSLVKLIVSLVVLLLFIGGITAMLVLLLGIFQTTTTETTTTTITTTTKPTSGWSNTSEINYARYRHTTSTLADGTVLIAGGQSGASFLNSAELYDPSMEMWTVTGSMHYARTSHTSSVLLSGKVLVTGGRNSGVFLTSSELYDPLTKTWNLTGSISSP